MRICALIALYLFNRWNQLNHLTLLLEERCSLRISTENMRLHQITSAYMVIKSKKLLRTVPEVLQLQQVMGQHFLHFRYCSQNSGCCWVLRHQLLKMDLAVDKIFKSLSSCDSEFSAHTCMSSAANTAS